MVPGEPGLTGSSWEKICPRTLMFPQTHWPKCLPVLCLFLLYFPWKSLFSSETLLAESPWLTCPSGNIFTSTLIIRARYAGQDAPYSLTCHSSLWGVVSLLCKGELRLGGCGLSPKFLNLVGTDPGFKPGLFALATSPFTPSFFFFFLFYWVLRLGPFQSHPGACSVVISGVIAHDLPDGSP